jgi:hypothetical protein
MLDARRRADSVRVGRTHSIFSLVRPIRLRSTTAKTFLCGRSRLETRHFGVTGGLAIDGTFLPGCLAGAICATIRPLRRRQPDQARRLPK